MLFERSSESVEARFPQVAVLSEPGVEVAEWVRPERVQTALPIPPHRYEPCFVKNAQVTRDTGLVDPRLLDEVADLRFTAQEYFDDAAASGVRQSLEGVWLHWRVYA